MGETRDRPIKIITSHERADMDALASIYAAALLYSDHQGVLPHKLNRNLRDFLALYQDALPFVQARKLARGRISEVILVDTQAIAPMRGMDAQTSIHIIDHHAVDSPLPAGSTFEGEPLGAATTLLVEKIRERAVALDKLGASLLLMGIYEDTGFLSYTTSTSRDAQAAAWLLEQGADLAVINKFLHRPLSDAQREALDDLISNSRLYTIRGRSVCISSIVLERYVDELSSLIHQIIDTYEPEACFLLAEYQHKVQIIARSVTQAIDVAALLQAFGGGGHNKAAAALVEGSCLVDVSEALIEALGEQVEPPTLVREIMSTNVHTLDLDISVRDAAQLMRRYGHEGFPVVENQRLIGILTRSDVDRALRHQLDDMPVRNILHTGLLHVRPEDPVSEVQRVMIEQDLGQIPVVDEGCFVGIVTRTDLIKLWTPLPRASRAQEIRDMMKQALPEGLQGVLIKARDAANDYGYSLYIVGGFVRDLLLGSPTLDLDMVVEGDAIRMARKLAPQLGGRVRSHARFGTAKIILEGKRPAGVPPSLDFVTARTEFYERPTVLPEVERSSIKQDLYRRDFTINTLAICLDRDRYGELLDYYGGERDIGEKRIRVLHNLSFVEDPTRILRAVRFEQRLGFVIEERTAELITDALDLLDRVTGERLFHELFLILREAEPEKSLDRLKRMGGLQHLHPSLRFSRNMPALFARLRERFQTRPVQVEAEAVSTRHEGYKSEATSAFYANGNAVSQSLCYLALLTSSMDQDELASFVERMSIRGDDARFLREVLRARGALSELAVTVMLPSGIYRLLHTFSREARFVLSVLTDSDLVRRRLDLYEGELSKVEPRVDGHYLQSLGVPPGPIYGEILERVRMALLDRQITMLEEEQSLVHRLVEVCHIGQGDD